MIFKKKNDQFDDFKKNSEQSVHNLKQEMIKSLLRKKNHVPISEIPNYTITNFNTCEPIEINPDSENTSVLIGKINQIKDRTIVPTVDLTTGKVTYPLLLEIGKNEDDVKFLENLCTKEQILEKIIHERILVCPKHTTIFSSNVRMYCPKCNSMDIKKLHLVEHINCGYISEQTNFETDSEKVTKCLSCSKKINDTVKELRIPAKWYSCNNCTEKFDDVSLKLHCREYDHDFDINSARSIDIPSFRIKTDESGTSIDTREIFEKLKILLNQFGFQTIENYSVRGRSGHFHSIDLYATNEKNISISIFIKKSDSEIDNSEINSKIIQVLDTSPTIAILIGFSSISEKAKVIATSYNVSIVASQNILQIIESTQEILSQNLGKVNESEIKPQSN